MKLYIISVDNQEPKTELLVKACQDRGIKYEVLNPEVVCPLDISINDGDAVCRVATMLHYGAAELEWDLIFRGAKSFYKDTSALLLKRIDSMLFEKFGIPAPKTVDYLPKDRDALLRCVDRLGGFPVCLKALGGSHGVGVMRVDSKQSLFSVSDYLREQGGMVVMKEYCDVASSARLIVLGDKVIDSIEYSAPKGDFRSNEGTVPNVSPKKFDPEVEEIAVRATHALGLEFGGVDIMITKDGPKVAEVNSPCFFPRCQMLTGTDIAGKMVEYLRDK
ncbi:hypothetical protein IK146_00580 [Candidatus Saccharibacteria bacterium]|nr:hypothetical protein [Candidatus Saccharibacteria bacterium]